MNRLSRGVVTLALVGGLTLNGCLGAEGLLSTATYGSSAEGNQSTSNEDDGSSLLVVTLLIAVVAAVVVPLTTTEMMEEARNYLHQNRRAIRVALSRGAGTFLRDLAAALQVPEALAPQVASAVRAARPALDGALAAEGDITAERTLAFAKALRHALLTNATLAPYVRALDARQAQMALSPG